MLSIDSRLKQNVVRTLRYSTSKTNIYLCLCHFQWEIPAVMWRFVQQYPGDKCNLYFKTFMIIITSSTYEKVGD